ncbi:lysophospholipid acyltransferase LPEAT1 [Olea europaea var. sylvestris]|uniref:lysophospholipid acyltransferase LPEAT1 n=1 Tax=Olea europaea var. sylvestris TaxID=158386 RepID=UPI000C1D4483|nr:lysophospholipid acyltransferase LPEAT1 [Olea europaea var. sylvestris]
MESELKTLAPTPSGSLSESTMPIDDDRPLLKSDPNTPQIQSQVCNPNIEEMEKKYAAYVRHDVYGTMGRGELPWPEKLLLALGLILLVPIRAVASMSILVIYYIICRLCTVLKAPNREDEQEDYAHMGGWRRAVIVQTGKFLSRGLLFVFGFYWIRKTIRSNDAEGKVNNENESMDQSEDMERPGAIVSNHVSYLDILYHMSSSFPSFVAKRSVAKLPLVGLISKCLGCIYVQRESKSSNFKGVSGIFFSLFHSICLNSSPLTEGTTTNGDYILPFKTGAFLAKAPVLPVILRYPYQRFSPAWDSISGARHVLLLLCQFVNYMEVTQLPVYCPSQQEKDDPKLYAENVRRLMAREGNLILTDIGLAEKRVYHAALNGNNRMRTVLHQKDD